MAQTEAEKEFVTVGQKRGPGWDGLGLAGACSWWHRVLQAVMSVHTQAG